MYPPTAASDTKMLVLVAKLRGFHRRHPTDEGSSSASNVPFVLIARRLNWVFKDGGSDEDAN